MFFVFVFGFGSFDKNQQSTPKINISTPGWRFATIAVTSNFERRYLNWLGAIRYAKDHDLPVIYWPSTVTGPEWTSLPETQRAALVVANQWLLHTTFVPGVESYLCQNINPEHGLANGTLVREHSITFEEHVQESVEMASFRQAYKVGKPGELILAPFKPTKNVECFYHANQRDAAGKIVDEFHDHFHARWKQVKCGVSLCWQEEEKVVLPVDPKKGFSKHDSVVLPPLPGITTVPITVLLAPDFPSQPWAMTFQKLQGRTMEKLIVDINKRPFLPEVTLDGLNVALTRVRSGSNMRRMPCQPNGNWKHLYRLSHNPLLKIYFAGYAPETGRWSAQRAKDFAVSNGIDVETCEKVWKIGMNRKQGKQRPLNANQKKVAAAVRTAQAKAAAETANAAKAAKELEARTRQAVEFLSFADTQAPAGDERLNDEPPGDLLAAGGTVEAQRAALKERINRAAAAAKEATGWEEVNNLAVQGKPWRKRALLQAERAGQVVKAKLAATAKAQFDAEVVVAAEQVAKAKLFAAAKATLDAEMLVAAEQVAKAKLVAAATAKLAAAAAKTKLDAELAAATKAAKLAATIKAAADQLTRVAIRQAASVTPARSTTWLLGRCGLNNLGNTCFLNSTLQCLRHLLPVCEYFCQNHHIGEINFQASGLAHSFGELVQLLCPTPPTLPNVVLAPYTLLCHISRLHPVFGNGRQHDSQEVLQFLLDGLHQDLERGPHPLIGSKIKDLFQGQFKTKVTCPDCFVVSEKLESYFTISLDVKSKKKLRNNKISKNGPTAKNSAATEREPPFNILQALSLFRYDTHTTR